MIMAWKVCALTIVFFKASGRNQYNDTVPKRSIFWIGNSCVHFCLTLLPGFIFSSRVNIVLSRN